MTAARLAALLSIASAGPAAAFCGGEIDLDGSWTASSLDRAVFVGGSYPTSYPPAEPQPMTFDLDDAYSMTAQGADGPVVAAINEWGPEPLDWADWFARVPDVALPDWEPAELALLSGCDSDADIPTVAVRATGSNPEMGASAILVHLGQIGEGTLVGFYEETASVEGQDVRVVQFMTLTR